MFACVSRLGLAFWIRAIGIFLIEIHDPTIVNRHTHLFPKPQPQKTEFALTFTIKFTIPQTQTVKFTFSPVLRPREC